MKDDPTILVREGYDKIGEKYDKYRSAFSAEVELDEFMHFIKPGSHVLDVGCGTGLVARSLVDGGLEVTGIDISKKMIDLAKHRVPEATFEIGDMTALEFGDESFDGIVSTYAIFHVPRTEHFKLFLDFHRFLKKGGFLLFSIGVRPEGTDGVWEWDEFQSVPMYWSYHGPEKSIELLKSADFKIISSRSIQTQIGPETETHFWILARAK